MTNTNLILLVLLLSQLLLQPGLFGLLQYFELPCDQVNLLTAHVPSGIELFIFGIRLRRLINSDLFQAIQNGQFGGLLDGEDLRLEVAPVAETFLHVTHALNTFFHNPK